MSVAENDGTLTAGLIIQDGNADGKIDVIIGAGQSSIHSAYAIVCCVPCVGRSVRLAFSLTSLIICETCILSLK